MGEAFTIDDHIIGIFIFLKNAFIYFERERESTRSLKGHRERETENPK